MWTAFKCRAYPTAEQAAMLARTFGCIRVAWNRTLAERQARYAECGQSTSFQETSRALTALKKQPEFSWLNEVSAVALQQTLRHQQQAFDAFFAKRSRYPRFKSRTGRQAASYTRAAFRMRDGALWLPKMAEPLRLVWSWPNIDIGTINPSTVVVSRDAAGRWFVSLAAEVADPTPLVPTDRSVGVDLGLKHFATLSTGEHIPHPQHMQQHEKRLRRYQRRCSRKRPGSANRTKAQRRVARQHARVADARKDFLHKITTRLVSEHDVIAIEDLPVTTLLQKRRVAKAVGEVGWFHFRALLTYKCERAGRRLIVVNRWYPSSKTCSCCGRRLTELSLDTRRWTCPGCGTLHDRDINAAKNILAAGLAVEACGGDVRRQGCALPLLPMKQEPSGVIPTDSSVLRAGT